jgi:hypothetical protein
MTLILSPLAAKGSERTHRWNPQRGDPAPAWLGACTSPHAIIADPPSLPYDPL